MAPGIEDIYFGAAGDSNVLLGSPRTTSPLNALVPYLESGAAKAAESSKMEVLGGGNTKEVQFSRERRRVSFDLARTTVHEITPYSEVFGIHPSAVFFGKFDKAPLCSFIADPDAEDVRSDMEQESDEETEADDDEGPQPVLTRRGFVRPTQSLAKPIAVICNVDEHQDVRTFAVKNDEDEDEDDKLTQEPNSRESSSSDLTSESSVGEEGLLESLTWCGSLVFKSQDVDTLDMSSPRQYRNTVASTERLVSLAPVLVGSHSVVESRAIGSGDDAAAQPLNSKASQEVDGSGHSCIAPLRDVAVMLCSLPAIIIRKFGNTCERLHVSAGQLCDDL